MIGWDSLDQIGISNQRAHSPFIISVICWQDQRKRTHWLWTLFCNFFYTVCGKFSQCALARLLTCYSLIKKRPALLMIWPCQNWCNPKPKYMPYSWSKSLYAHLTQYTVLLELQSITIKTTVRLSYLWSLLVAVHFTIMLFHILLILSYFGHCHIRPTSIKANYYRKMSDASHSVKLTLHLLWNITEKRDCSNDACCGLLKTIFWPGCDFFVKFDVKIYTTVMTVHQLWSWQLP